MVVFGLRTRMGIPRSRFKNMTGQELDSVIDPDFLDLCVQSNFLKVDDSSAELKYIPNHLQDEVQGGIRPTEEGLARMDSILLQLLQSAH